MPPDDNPIAVNNNNNNNNNNIVVIVIIIIIIIKTKDRSTCRQPLSGVQAPHERAQEGDHTIQKDGSYLTGNTAHNYYCCAL